MSTVDTERESKLAQILADNGLPPPGPARHVRTPPTRPLLRWLGGKWMLSPWIISHFPSHEIYTEAYGGGASVLLRKQPCYAEVYNDLDGDLVNLFRIVRDRGPELREAIRLTPFAREEFDATWEALPEDTPDPPLEKARRFLVRSFFSFGADSAYRYSGFRSTAFRQNTIPSHDWKNYPAALGGIIDRLQGVVLENREARTVIEAADSGTTLHYVDPPYLKETRGVDAKYTHELTREDHEALAETLHSAKGTVILSGYDNPLYRKLYPEWETHQYQTYADGARPRVETLWIKYANRTQTILPFE